jgi:ABC-type uncharacterized transport system fused permease/ATPase subunit
MKKLLFIVLLVLTGEAILTSILPYTRGWLFDSLSIKSSAVWTIILIYFFNNLVLYYLQEIKDFVVLKTSLLFRYNRTHKIIDQKFKDITNIPQRIQEDIKLSYFSRYTVYAEYYVSGIILIHLVILNLSVPLLVVLSIGYAFISILIALLFNPKLTKAEVIVQQSEANYRRSLMDSFNLQPLTIANLACITAGKIRLGYGLFNQLQLTLILILPYVVLIPLYLHGIISLGTLVKHQTTFSLIVVNAAILIQYFPTLIQGKASEKRVKEMLE